MFFLPNRALSQLVEPVVTMQHIEWHKDNSEQISSAQVDDAGDYYGDYYEEEEEDGFDAYVNEFGDYIIDDFYNEMDGTQWVVTNEYTTDLHDEWQQDNVLGDDVPVFSAKANTQSVTTSAAQVLSSKCM